MANSTSVYRCVDAECSSVQWNNHVSIVTNHTDGNVYVTMKKEPLYDGEPPTWGMEYTFTWNMYLQRIRNGSWSTISDRTGYVAYGDPSNRTFYNIGHYGTLRLLLYFYADGNLTKVTDSKNWYW